MISDKFALSVDSVNAMMTSRFFSLDITRLKRLGFILYKSKDDHGTKFNHVKVTERMCCGIKILKIVPFLTINNHQLYYITYPKISSPHVLGEKI